MEQPVATEELADPDVNNVSSLDAAGTVKTEPADVNNYVYSLEEETITKDEMDIEPTVIRPPVIQYMTRPCKPEPDEAATSEKCPEQHESMEQPVVKEELADPDVDNVSLLDAAGTVKTEPADVSNDVYSLEEETIAKEEMDIEPTVIRPPVFQYMTRPGKPEPDEAATSEKWSEQHESMEQPVVKEELADPDVDNVSSLDAAGTVKTEPADVSHDVYSLEEETIAKEEMDIEPTVIRPPVFQYMTRPGKPEPDEAATSETTHHHSTSSKESNSSADQSAGTPLHSQYAHTPLHSRDVCTEKKDLKRHIMIHVGEKPYQCHVCKKSFTRKSNLKYHIMVIHTTEKPHECHICKKSFTIKTALKRHVMIHTAEKLNECHICKKSFTQKKFLKVHIMIHAGEKPYQCYVCKKSFIRKSYLKYHILVIHTTEKPNECHICKKSFTVKTTLKRHVMSHNAEKPHECHVCKRSFTLKSTLKSHIMIHTGEKPYQCDVCKRSFTQKSALKRHIMIHTREKPHECHVCKKSFILKSALKSHIMIHTGEKPYQCHVCKKSFTRKTNLKSHYDSYCGKASLVSLM